MSGRKSRDKGARGELAVCKLLSQNLGGEYTRNLKQYQKSQQGDISQLAGPFLIEVKNCADKDHRGWWKQALTAADKVGAIPCVAWKESRGNWRFRIPLREAWETGHQWGRDVQYTQDLYPQGFFLLVRERS